MTDGRPDRGARSAHRTSGRYLPPRVTDVLVALGWLLLSSPTFVIAVVDQEADPRPASATVVALFVPSVLIVAVALVLWRRRRPVLAYVVAMAVTVPFAAYDPGVSNIAAAFCVFAIAVHDSARRAWICAAVSVSFTVVTAAITVAFGSLALPIAVDGRIGTAAFFIVTGVLTLLVGLMWGLGVRARRGYIDELIAHARVLEHDLEQQAKLAALAERSRIARDVHDIVSHSLSVIVRLADGAEAVFDSDPVRARGAVGDVATVARSSLTEMRRVMSVLEDPTATDPLPSGSGLDDLPQLIDVFRGVGLPVGFDLAVIASCAPGVQMAVFRVVQEALTNVLRHSGSASSVQVAVVIDRDVTVSIVNDGAPVSSEPDARPGRGLVGMHERAALYGGALTAGPDGEGRWVVHLVLPAVGE